MNWEVNDYRDKPPKPDLGSWPFWSVPGWYVPMYLVRVVFWVFVLPWLFGQSLTAWGTLITFLLIDYWIYWSMKKAYEQE